MAVIFTVLLGMAGFGLFLSGIAAMRQAALGKKLFNLRLEQMRREQSH
jgi:hypothetical protein